ncbi:MAG: oligopeptide/dipeptide ABC transporter ATP-binding protein [Dongiaceae bacterium]
MNAIHMQLGMANNLDGAPLLEVSSLTVRYPLVNALTARLLGIRRRFLDAVIDVSFTLREGRTMALVGESGSGKSSLGRAIVGLQPFASGQVSFGGRNPFADRLGGNSAYHRKVAMMFQDAHSSLSPRRSVRALIAEPFIIHGLRDRDLRAEVERLLGLVGLPKEFAERYPHQLSGGQARRVGVARAIALNPKLIVADEPTSGLDVSVQADILNLLLSLQRKLGLSYLIITHNLALVRHVSDDAAIMYMGRFVEQGPTAEIFACPAHPYTLALLQAQPRPDPDLRRQEAPLLGEVPSLFARPIGCEFHTRCSKRAEICYSQPPELSQIAPSRSCRCFFPDIATR